MAEWLQEGTFVYELKDNPDARSAKRTPKVNKWSLQVQGNGQETSVEERIAIATLIQATPDLLKLANELATTLRVIMQEGSLDYYKTKAEITAIEVLVEKASLRIKELSDSGPEVE